MVKEQPSCPVCDGVCVPLGTVDFNKNCEERHGVQLPSSGRLVQYAVCRGCGFAFAPEFSTWTPEDFRREIYNAGYALVDPDHAEVRPTINAESVLATFGDRGRALRHLDYGGGAGRLSEQLRNAHWRSTSYDPFFDTRTRLEDLGQFELITCFEVFEHVPDVNQLVDRLSSLLSRNGLILVSTLLSDGQVGPGQPLTWWYAAPRNGHINLFSSRSLAMLAARHGFRTASMTPDLHLFWRQEFPRWARHLLAPGAKV
jgi:SAM-dependent methyltransferase